MPAVDDAAEDVDDLERLPERARIDAPHVLVERSFLRPVRWPTGSHTSIRRAPPEWCRSTPWFATRREAGSPSARSPGPPRCGAPRPTRSSTASI
jgi:hypothetical protein